jgi:hypothetical protein
MDIKEDEEEIFLPGLDFNQSDEKEDSLLPGLSPETKQNYKEEIQSNSITNNEDYNNDDEEFLPGLSTTTNNIDNISSNITDDQYNNNYNSEYSNENITSYLENSINNQEQINEHSTEEQIETIDLSYLMSPSKKIVTFVGTSKNGTSFIVNNLAQLISSSGVNTAILDTTKNKNSYYIYTKNEEELRNIATHSIENLANGIANGIQVNKNLTVYTSLPNEGEAIINVDRILETLLKQHSLILIDTDFETPINYFKQSQETYLVQTLDILTIQPLTAFLRELKARNILEEKKLRVVLNKVVKIRGVNDKTIIGGMAYYNDPAMSFMTELFDRSFMKYISIPFEEETYIKYLEGIIECNISLKGYSKIFMNHLKNLSNMVYPTANTYNPPTSGNRIGNNTFSPNINNTLNQMKNNY